MAYRANAGTLELVVWLHCSVCKMFSFFFPFVFFFLFLNLNYTHQP